MRAEGSVIASLIRLIDLVKGYDWAETFGRAFRAVHGESPGQEVRREGGLLRMQPRLRFRLTV